MNIIKKVSVFVMGIVVIGIVSTAVGVTIQTKNVEKSVTFVLLENNELIANVYDQINDYMIVDNNLYANNIVSISVNGNYNFFDEVGGRHNGTYIIINDDVDDDPIINIYPNNTYEVEGSSVLVGDTISVTFAVEVKTPTIIKTLLVLIPLVLTASVIGYLVVKKGDE